MLRLDSAADVWRRYRIYDDGGITRESVLRVVDPELNVPVAVSEQSVTNVMRLKHISEENWRHESKITTTPVFFHPSAIPGYITYSIYNATITAVTAYTVATPAVSVDNVLEGGLAISHSFTTSAPNGIVAVGDNKYLCLFVSPASRIAISAIRVRALLIPRAWSSLIITPESAPHNRLNIERGSKMP